MKKKSVIFSGFGIRKMGFGKKPVIGNFHFPESSHSVSPQNPNPTPKKISIPTPISRIPTPKTGSAGFTLLELIAVIAIMALIGSLVVMSSSSILQGIGERPVEEIFRLALREARFLAASEKETVSLGYDHEAGSFVVFSEGNQVLYERDTGYGEDSSDIDVIFRQRISGKGLDPERNEEWEETLRVYFRPDRSSTPFEVTFDLRDEVISHRYDPFSDIVIEEDSR